MVSKPPRHCSCTCASSAAAIRARHAGTRTSDSARRVLHCRSSSRRSFPRCPIWRSCQSCRSWPSWRMPPMSPLLLRLRRLHPSSRRSQPNPKQRSWSSPHRRLPSPWHRRLRPNPWHRRLRPSPSHRPHRRSRRLPSPSHRPLWPSRSHRRWPSQSHSRLRPSPSHRLHRRSPLFDRPSLGATRSSPRRSSNRANPSGRRSPSRCRPRFFSALNRPRRQPTGSRHSCSPRRQRPDRQPAHAGTARCSSPRVHASADAAARHRKARPKRRAEPDCGRAGAVPTRRRTATSGS